MKTSSLILLTVICSASASALFFSPSAITAEIKKASNEKQAATAITFRKSLLQLVSSNMGPLGAMAKGNIPMDADVIARNASRIEFLSDMVHEYFALDTSNFSIETDAKDGIWKNYDDFTSKANDLVRTAGELQELVVNDQQSEFRKGIGEVGASCKACHDEYRKD